MSEYIVNIPDDEARYFIARFGIESVKLLGYRLSDEIIRCKDCAWFDPYTDEDTNGLCVGACWYFAHQPKVGSHGFCSWAVKKVDNHA